MVTTILVCRHLFITKKVKFCYIFYDIIDNEVLIAGLLPTLGQLKDINYLKKEVIYRKFCL